MSVERPDSVPVVSDIYNVDFAQLFRLGNKPTSQTQNETISQEPKEDSNSEGEK